MTSWNTMQTDIDSAIKRSAVREMAQMAKKLCDKAGYEKVRAAFPGKGKALDDASYKKIVLAFADALKASVTAKKEAE